jgi:hypothetical protein
MNLPRVIAWVILIAAACPVSTHARPPGALNHATHAERWEASSQVVYGEVVSLHFIDTSEDQVHYRIKLRISQRWKGSTEEEITLTDSFPKASREEPFRFKFGATYIVFAAKEAHETDYSRNYAVPVSLPLPPGADSFGSIFGTTRPAYNNRELLQFLESQSSRSAEATAPKSPAPENKPETLLP